MHTPHTNTPLYQNNILSPDSEGMSRLRLIMFVSIIVSLFLAFTTRNAIPSVSFTVSNQLKYWFKNVKDHMLEATLSKLSPLNKDDTEFFTLYYPTNILDQIPSFAVLPISLVTKISIA